MKSADKSHARSRLGAQGEELVAVHLREQGYHILVRNARWRGGEIDIIAKRESIIACVEVKTRRSHYFPLSTVVTPAKQRKIILTAQHFCAVLRLTHTHAIRFDIALVESVAGEWNITYIEHAFTKPEE